MFGTMWSNLSSLIVWICVALVLIALGVVAIAGKDLVLLWIVLYISLVLIFAAIYKRLTRDIHTIHKNIVTSLDQAIYEYDKHLWNNRDNIVAYTDSLEVLEYNQKQFFSWKHTTTKDLQEFYENFQEDIIYLTKITQWSIPFNKTSLDAMFTAAAWFTNWLIFIKVFLLFITVMVFKLFEPLFNKMKVFQISE